MLKKVVINFFVIMALMIIFAGVANAAPVGQYTRTGYIEDVDRVDDFTVLVDRTGHVWFWESATFQTKHGRRFLKTGSRVVIVLDGRGTPEVTDDRVIDFEAYS